MESIIALLKRFIRHSLKRDAPEFLRPIHIRVVSKLKYEPY